jgi:hypothetical protein
VIAEVFVDCTHCLALVKSVNIKEHLVLAHTRRVMSDPVLPVLRNQPYGARIEYVYEDGTWWAYANLAFSSADTTLVSLKFRVHKALREVLGDQVEYVEVVHGVE